MQFQGQSLNGALNVRGLGNAQFSANTAGALQRYQEKIYYIWTNISKH